MRASQTVLPFKLTASDESLTAQAGLALFDEYLGAMGISGLTREHDVACGLLRHFAKAAGAGEMLNIFPNAVRNARRAAAKRGRRLRIMFGDEARFGRMNG
jgi:hypothetical protein